MKRVEKESRAKVEAVRTEHLPHHKLGRGGEFCAGME
jgi:hypothetical protein